MGELITKEIEFQGQKILSVIQDEKIYISVKSICENLGMTEGQMKNQRNKIQNDELLKLGLKFVPADTGFGIKEKLMIELDYLPIWLAKINPARFDEELKNRLMIYQLKAKDVLSDEFLGKRIKSKDWAIGRMHTRLDQCEFVEDEIISLMNFLNGKYEEIENISRIKRETIDFFIKQFKRESGHDVSKEKLPVVIIPED